MLPQETRPLICVFETVSPEACQSQAGELLKSADRQGQLSVLKLTIYGKFPSSCERRHVRATHVLTSHFTRRRYRLPPTVKGEGQERITQSTSLKDCIYVEKKKLHSSPRSMNGSKREDENTCECSVCLQSRCTPQQQQQQIFIKSPVTGCWKPSLSLFTAVGRHHKEAPQHRNSNLGSF